jgi:hypothetical protein
VAVAELVVVPAPAHLMRMALTHTANLKLAPQILGMMTSVWSSLNTRVNCLGMYLENYNSEKRVTAKIRVPKLVELEGFLIHTEALAR